MSPKILIVEDEKSTRENLIDVLKQHFPSGVIEYTEDVDQALDMIHRHEPFDIAILDVRLPKSLGLANERNDRSICNRIRDTSGATAVFHFSSHLEEADIKQHLEDVHSNDKYAPWFDKRDVDYPTKIVNAIKCYLYGQKIAVKMRDLLGVEEIHVRVRTTPIARRYSLTNELADLFADIVEYWDYLDESLRKAIRKNLNLDDTDHPTRVSLL